MIDGAKKNRVNTPAINIDSDLSNGKRGLLKIPLFLEVATQYLVAVGW